LENAVADRTRIVFAGGDELVVDEEPSQVMDLLLRKEPFHRSTTAHDVAVFIVSDQVAYLQRVPESEPMVG
jgi:hypothetical protein